MILPCGHLITSEVKGVIAVTEEHKLCPHYWGKRSYPVDTWSPREADAVPNGHNSNGDYPGVTQPGRPKQSDWLAMLTGP